MSDLDRHVIKGRGKNRGMYLCYARLAGLPPEAGFVWLPEQQKAMRCKDPRYSGETYTTIQAREHNWYFVKLTCPKSLNVDGLRDFIAAHTAGAAEHLPCHWFGADFHDAGEDFCRECAEKLVDEKYKTDPKAFEDRYGECESAEERYAAAIDGGWRTEHDSPPYCETCGAPLDGSLTAYGMREEIEALTGEYAPSFRNAEDWKTLNNAIGDLNDDHPLWRKIARVVEAATKEEAEAHAAAAALAVSPGMPEARSALLGMLSARAIQKAPDPSFRLWEELKAYLRLPFEERLRAKGEVYETEKRLVKEAETFAKLLGYQWSGNSINAPYGQYYWPVVVWIEQYKLWQTPVFLEGVAYMRHLCLSGDPKWPHHHRDANPYPDGSEEHDQWNCGYVSAMKERASDAP